MYGRWGEVLDPPMLARALLALGITASRDPAAATWKRADQIAAGLRRAVDDLYRRTYNQAWNRTDPWVWTDPLLLDGWQQDDVESGVQWARAWDALGGQTLRWVRLAMSVAPDTDLIWLSESLGQINGSPGGFVSYRGRQASSWRFPLRIGYLPDQEGRAAFQSLVDGFAESSWQSTLIDPIVLGPTRVSCDILLLTANPWDAPTKLYSVRHELRAGAVLIDHDLLGLHSLTRQVVDKIGDVTGAWAVGVTELASTSKWIVNLVRELSHATPLDMAFYRVSASSPYVLAADPVINARETADQRAMRLAATLRSIATSEQMGEHAGHEVPVARELLQIVEQGQFISEAGDASEISRLEGTAGEIIDYAGSLRRLQARIAPTASPAASLTAFLPGVEHSIEVRIGPPSRGSEWLVSEVGFPEEQLQPEQPHRLTVVLTEPHLLDAPQTSVIELPVVGTSTSAMFTLTTRPDTTAVDARIIVLSGNRILQTALLTSTVGPPSAVARLSEPELVIAPTAANIADRRTFRAAFLVNRNDDGTKRATVIAGDRDCVDAAMVNLDSITIAAAVKKISDRLNAIVDSPTDYGTLDSPSSVQLLVFLAVHGEKLRRALLHYSPKLGPVLERAPSLIQVVSAKPDAYFPFELAYDFPAPNRDARLCPDALPTLLTADPERRCPGSHTEDVVCPLGFWGLHRVIERHAYNPHDRITDAFMLRSAPTRTRHTIRLGRAVLGTSTRVDKIIASGTQGIAAAFRTVCSCTQVSDWAAWVEAVAAPPAPSLLTLVPHTVYDDIVGEHGLEIGDNSFRYKDFDKCLPPQEQPVLIMVLGCETATASALSYEQFPAEFLIAGAEVVIATLTEILGRHAAPIASRLVAEIYRHCATEPHGMGEVMLLLRRRMLAEGVLPVLALATFGDADWLVGP